MSDDLIDLGNGNKLLLTPFDARIVREFIDTLQARAEAAEARVKELEAERDKILGRANRQEDRAEAAEARVKVLEEALRYYADERNMEDGYYVKRSRPPIWSEADWEDLEFDNGNVARATLAAMEKR